MHRKHAWILIRIADVSPRGKNIVQIIGMLFPLKIVIGKRNVNVCMMQDIFIVTINILEGILKGLWTVIKMDNNRLIATASIATAIERVRIAINKLVKHIGNIIVRFCIISIFQRD